MSFVTVTVLGFPVPLCTWVSPVPSVIWRMALEDPAGTTITFWQ